MKAAVYDEVGNLLGFGRSVCDFKVSSEGCAAVLVESICNSAKDAVKTAVRHSDAEIRSMAISSNGLTLVPLDDNFCPTRPAVIFYESWASEQADIRRNESYPSSHANSGTLTSSVASLETATLRRKIQRAMRDASKYMSLADYIIYKLTGISDIDSNAPGISVGKLLPDAAKDWGLSAETLLVTGTNEQYAGALGTGNCKPGIVSESTDTSFAFLTLAEKLPESIPSGLFGDRFLIDKYEFALAYSKTAGLIIDWFNKKFCPDLNLDELDQMAKSVSVGSNGVTVVPSFDGLVSSNQNQDVNGFICGLTLGTGIAEVYRAILESIAFLMREKLDLLDKADLETKVIRSIGTGVKSNLWLQIKADVTGIPVERPKVSEAVTLGAAAVAAFGVGDYSSIQEASHRFYHCDKIFEPNSQRQLQYETPYKTYRSICKSVL